MPSQDESAASCTHHARAHIHVHTYMRAPAHARARALVPKIASLRLRGDELKELKEGDFKKVNYYEKVDGLNCDKAVIDACREALKGDGRVNAEDAKNVFAKIADANKVTRIERRTLWHCRTTGSLNRGRGRGTAGEFLIGARRCYWPSLAAPR